jgi:putative endonuclease
MGYQENLGKIGEEMAIHYLKGLGYQIRVTNFRCKLGEIDIIAEDQKIIVFIEVRTRKSETFGPAYNSVTYPKQQQVKKVALYYISQNNLVNTQFRFDVIGIYLPNSKSEKPRIDHIQNAF